MSAWHWIIVIIVVLLVFGTGKLRNIGSDLGAAIKGFKKSMEEGDASVNKQLKGPDKDADFNTSAGQSTTKAEQKNG